MDDLRMVRELGDGTPLSSPADLAPARERFVAGITPVRLRRHRPRYALVGASTAGLAAAVAAVITLAPGPAPTAGAAEVLTHAAAAARAQDEPQARPDQFVYVRSQGPGGQRESWQSVDGTRDGLIEQRGERLPLPGCRDGRVEVSEGGEPRPGPATKPCTPTPAFRTDLPTDADGMLAHLDANANGKAGTVNSRGKDVYSLIAESYLPPATRAALFEAAARVPGLSVRPDVRDAAGRPGVGITWPPADPRPNEQPMVLVFDASTYGFLGTTHSSVVAMSIVDEAGRRP